MNRSSIKILLVDDNPEVLSLLADLLKEEDYSVHEANSIEEAESFFKHQNFHLVITDLRLKNESGLDLMSKLHSYAPSIPVIIMTAYGTVESAIEAMQKGAFDYIEKPFHSEKILLTIARAIETSVLRTEVDQLRSSLEKESSYYQIISQSPKMKQVFHLIERLKTSDLNVLVTGPSGTGKELIARAIHESSTRRHHPFVALNCSAIPEALLEGELFGYKKGAFTDARADKKGLLSEASGGTFFMDEIGDLPLSLQPKLLRAIQQKEIRPLGSVQQEKINCRLIAATNQNLLEMVHEKRFREDLFYRLNVVQIELPPLKERREDIPLLVRHFLKKMSGRFQKNLKGVQESALQSLLSYDWPGNVRELENVVERAAALAEEEWITTEDFHLPFHPKTTSFPAQTDQEKKELFSLAEMEKQYILRVLDSVNQNKSQAAKILEIDRKTLYNKLNEYGLITPEFSDQLSLQESPKKVLKKLHADD